MLSHGEKDEVVMAKNNEKMVDQITSMDVDFGQWYTDVVKKAELADYSGVKGCMIFRPYGYAIWENIQKDLDARFIRPLPRGSAPWGGWWRCTY